MITYEIPCLLGLEKLVADEVKRLGLADVRAENGRVLCQGSWADCARLNINLRCGARVVALLGQFPAQSFEELFQGVRAIAWEEFLPRDAAFPVKGYSISSQLHSVPACQSIIKKAVVKSLSAVYHVDWFEESGPTVSIRFSIMKNAVSIGLDTSGVALHKRGWRAQSNAAPIKETLAAGMVWLAHPYDDSTVYDPFCGSGTLVIEAALKALNIAPGINRHFAFEKWFKNGETLLKEERAKAVQSVRRDATFHAYASDIDPECVCLTRENAKKAGIASRITVTQADVRDFKVTTERGIILTNPPYGERLLDIRAAHDLYRLMGEVFEKRNTLSYYIISPSEEFEQYFGAKADRKRKLYNGMIKCDLHMYFRNPKEGKGNENHK
ncbi:MAG TPA: RNA methyltransferase [Ruminococcaceae bacterium]|nr:RNA methyltransferase [Oscillospiraceae bacterium]